MVAYWREPSYRHMAFMVICAVLSAYYHLGNVAVFGATFIAILLRRPPKGVLHQGSAAALLFALLWLPYAVVQQWFHPGGFHNWWVWGKGLAEGYSPLSQPAGAFHWDILKNLALTEQTSVKSVIWFDSWNGWVMLRFGAFILLAVLAVCYPRWKLGWKRADREQAANNENSLAFVFLIPLLSVGALYAVWLPGMPNYWCVHTPLFCLFAGALSGRLSPGRMFPFQTICLVLVLPDKVNPQQFVVDASRKIGELTPAESRVIVSGRGGPWYQLKVYIPYFSHRRRMAIDLFASNAIIRDTDPIIWIEQEIADTLDRGIPIYITEDALREKGSFSDFNLSSQQIESIWKPFRLLPIQDFPGDPPNRLYLLWYDHFPKNVEDHIRTRLIASGLLDQAILFDKEKARTNPSEQLAQEITALEAAISKRNAHTSPQIQ
jgi:hypothetical protein